MSEQTPQGNRPIGAAELAGAADSAEPTVRHRPGKRFMQAVVAGAIAIALAAGGSAILPALFAGDTGAQPPLTPGEPVQPPAGTAAGFAEQELNWVSCGDQMQCADAYAPLDWDDPAGETITLRLVKRVATGSDPLGTLFVNPGGPGAAGTDYVAAVVDTSFTPEIRAAYDIVGWDPRGVGNSSSVSCLDSAGMDEYLFGLGEDDDLEFGSDEWIASSSAAAAEFGAACAEETGPLIGNVDTMSTVHDLDMLRAVVGDSHLNYLGFSYGTYIGARYADTFPDRVGRVVLDGAMDPTTDLSDVVRAQTVGFESSLRTYVTDCLQRRGCPLTGTVDEAMGQISALLDQLDEAPLTGKDGRSVGSSTMLTAIIAPLYSESNWGYLDDLFSSVSDGNAETALQLADFYYDRQNGEYLSNSTEAFSAINCLDYPRQLDNDQMRADAAELAELAPTIGRFHGFGDTACAEWPVTGVSDRPAVTGAGAQPILVVGTTGDPATPYQWAQSLAEQLESGTLITYRGEGHTAYGESSCVSSLVDDYLLTGAVPETDPLCSV